MMSIQALQTGTVSIKENHRRGEGHGFGRVWKTIRDRRWTEPLPIHAWLIEHPEGLILVDTGETARINEPGYISPWLPYIKRNVREWVTPEQEIGPQLAQGGYRPNDVRWVIMTHLHPDHSGGLTYFPQAEILVAHAEHHVAQGRRGQIRGYLPQHWPAWFAPQLVDYPDGPLGAFASSRRVTQAGDVWIVPTPGHTPGHQAVIVQDADRHYFFTGDLAYSEAALLAGTVDGAALDERAARATICCIQEYMRSYPTVLLPSHEAAATTRLADRRATDARRAVAPAPI